LDLLVSLSPGRLIASHTVVVVQGDRCARRLFRARLQLLNLPCGPRVTHPQPERITEVDGIAIGEAIEIEAAGQADRIFLGISPDRCMCLRPHARKPQSLLLLAASPCSFLIVKSTPKPGRVFRGGSAVPLARTKEAFDERALFRLLRLDHDD